MENKKLVGFYDYTVILTYVGMCFAFSGIMLSVEGKFKWTIICLMLAGICDMFDGAIASTKDRNVYEKKFGIQIDSFSDLISFGVLPAILVFEMSGHMMVARILACAFVLCALIRLAYYNVQEEDRQARSSEEREKFLGVPVTTAALLFPLVFLLYSFNIFHSNNWLFVALIVLGAGFISGFEIKKPKKIGKVILIIIGIVELVGMFLVTG